ncbi:glycosyltransferase family 4 protein [[Mycobacterium] zoologicum]|uniref:glycosyltransferase family 4 protein n=1 Tax=[Mycobacterium] zoologicum TaxID=2872311 RepID=UPI002CD6848E|nr:glycosyltransferase family 4 protein [Mycolicibacter sp. MYC101]MEB3065628.1 glycosyltransferase family 4 protein [Mycolicibacter sp. MYC101]
MTETEGGVKVLVISLHHPELMRGGAQQIAYELFQGLQNEPGIDPVLLASTDMAYPALYKAGACITGFDQRPNEFLFLPQEYNGAWHRTSSVRLIDAYCEFLQTIRPDVVHFHHFLTYGIDLLTLTRQILPNARLVFTFHEFLSICEANGHMVRTTDQSLCSQASPVRCHQCFPDRPPEHFSLRKMWFMRHLQEVDAFTCPSSFMIDRFVAWGIDADKIRHVSNGQAHSTRGSKLPVNDGPKNRFGFFGQMVDIKGIQIILRAVAILRGQGFTDLKVELNGDNLRHATPAVRKEIEDFLSEENERPFAERIVQSNGSYHTDELASRMARVDWSIVPSLWEEVFGLVVSEAWAFRRPVICSDVGALAERITDDVDGIHFTRGDPYALAAVMRRAATEAGLWERFSSAIPEPPSRAVMVEEFLDVYGLKQKSDSSPVLQQVSSGAVAEETDATVRTERPPQRPTRISDSR